MRAKNCCYELPMDSDIAGISNVGNLLYVHHATNAVTVVDLIALAPIIRTECDAKKYICNGCVHAPFSRATQRFIPVISAVHSTMQPNIVATHGRVIFSAANGLFGFFVDRPGLSK